MIGLISWNQLLTGLALMPKAVLRKLDRILCSPLGLTLICSGISIVVLFLRKHDLFTNPQFHAEDGVVLFTEAYYEGCRATFTSYAGYQILYQRLVACAGLALPLEHVPLFYFLSMLFTIVLVIAYVFRARVPFGSKAIVALALVLSPVRNEVFFGPTNSQWILALILVLLLVSDAPRTLAQASYDLLLLCLVGVTGPYCLVFLPLFALRLLWHRDRWSLLLAVADVLLCIIQTWDMEKIERLTGAGGTMFDYARVLTFYFGSLFAGPYAEVDAAQSSTIWAIAAVAIVVYCAAAIFALYKRDFVMLICSLVGPLVICATLYAFRFLPLALIGPTSRYWFIPTVTFIWLLISFSKYSPKIAYSLIGIMSFNVLLNFSFYQGPYFKDMQWKKWAPCIESHAQVCIIPHPPENWQTIICKTHDACDVYFGKK